MTREQAVEKLREVCREIGCSGLEPKMCKERPQTCAIIRRLVAAPAGEETITDGYMLTSVVCLECGKPTMQVVRPGKVQCSECG